MEVIAKEQGVVSAELGDRCGCYLCLYVCFFSMKFFVLFTVPHKSG